MYPVSLNMQTESARLDTRTSGRVVAESSLTSRCSASEVPEKKNKKRAVEVATLYRNTTILEHNTNVEGPANADSCIQVSLVANAADIRVFMHFESTPQYLADVAQHLSYKIDPAILTRIWPSSMLACSVTP